MDFKNEPIVKGIINEYSTLKHNLGNLENELVYREGKKTKLHEEILELRKSKQEMEKNIESIQEFLKGIDLDPEETLEKWVNYLPHNF